VAGPRPGRQRRARATGETGVTPNGWAVDVRGGFGLSRVRSGGCGDNRASSCGITLGRVPDRPTGTGPADRRGRADAGRAPFVASQPRKQAAAEPPRSAPGRAASARTARTRASPAESHAPRRRPAPSARSAPAPPPAADRTAPSPTCSASPRAPPWPLMVGNRRPGRLPGSPNAYGSPAGSVPRLGPGRQRRGPVTDDAGFTPKGWDVDARGGFAPMRCQDVDCGGRSRTLPWHYPGRGTPPEPLGLRRRAGTWTRAVDSA
jgi:hypothetical protein